ncbi:MAG: phosphatase PAP2 family protein [Bacteroidota bacterium]
MLEWLIEIDKSIFLFLNGLGHPFLDMPMIWLSDKYIWFPFYGYLIYRLFQRYHYSFYQPLITLILIIVITDQTTSGFMKPFFERLRPCHEDELTQLIVLIKGCGGSYGFASSHAANAFGLASFFYFTERSTFSIVMLIWAFLVSYSRIYMGVHYPFDILVGALIGIIAAYSCKTLLYKLNPGLIEN